MKSFYNKILYKKRIIIIMILFVIIFNFVLDIKPLLAEDFDAVGILKTGGNLVLGGIGTAIASVLGVIAYLITAVIGLLITLVIAVLVQVAQFNNIINVPTVSQGWVIIRDLCNMFFILILLVIAFATILRIESYSAKRLLPKLLIMAVLINFSKTIFGLLIDFSQVIMLTFVNAFKEGHGWFIEMFKTNVLLSIKSDSSKEFAVTAWSTALAIIAGVLAAIITLITITVLLVVLVFRIVMLWIYTILSPLVFFGFAFPPLQKYTGRIWEDFVKQLVVGPMLAFFIWLALTTASTSTDILGKGNTLEIKGTEVCAGIGSFFCEDNFQKFIITIALLIGGLMVTQQIGGVAGSAAGKGMQWARKASLAVGGAAAGAALFVPKQYAKRAGYGAADLTLEGLKRAPIIGNLAMEAQAKLRMKRDYAEEKDTRYMKYLPEQDLDRVITRQRAGGPLSLLARGMESRRQGFKSALTEKVKRGEEWGMDKNTKMRNKTQAMIELAQLAGHTVTASGEDAFRDADLGKLWHEFRYKNVGMIDDSEMRPYFVGGVGGISGRQYRGLRGGDNSEYYRGPDPITGNPRSPNSMPVYTASRMRMSEVHSLHHENLAPRVDAGGNLHYDVLDTVYNEGGGAMRTIAQVRDRGTRQQKDELRGFYQDRLNRERAGLTPTQHFLDNYNQYIVVPAHTGHTDNQYLDALMANGGYAGDPIGRSRPVITESESKEASSGITGLDKIEKGRLALNFSEVGLDKSAAKYFDGADKEKVAGRIGGLLRNKGMADDMAKAIEEQIKKASYLILHNKEAGISSPERRGAVAHELLHARIGNTFRDEELKGVWNSVDEGSRETARQKVKKIYGNDNMSEDAIMHEYFTEGLTNKTRWAEKNPDKKITLDSKAENSLEDLLKSKGSNIASFTSNLTSTKPLSTPLYTDTEKEENITNTIVEVSDPQLQGAMKDLVGAIQNMGNGFDSIKNVAGSLRDLSNVTDKNRLTLENSAREYRYNASKLNKLSEKIA